MTKPEWLTDPSQDPEPAIGDAQHCLPAETPPSLERTAIIPLGDCGSIRVAGLDAEAFLQGQLSNDVLGLRSTHAQLTSLSSPKGRVLNVFTAFRHADGIILETTAELVPSTVKRLRMYVLRSRVELVDATKGLPSLGIAGSESIAALASIGFEAPVEDWGIIVRESACVMRRPGPTARFSLHAPPTELRAYWEILRRSYPAAPVGVWRLLDILAGIPRVTEATQDRFVAQMLNLDLLGGISFTKGCYTGQEIVARLHYLGALKRRMRIGTAPLPVALPGMQLRRDHEGQSAGEVVDAARHPDGRQALLAVVPISDSEDRSYALDDAGSSVIVWKDPHPAA